MGTSVRLYSGSNEKGQEHALAEVTSQAPPQARSPGSCSKDAHVPVRQRPVCRVTKVWAPVCAWPLTRPRGFGDVAEPWDLKLLTWKKTQWELVEKVAVNIQRESRGW